MKYIHVIEKTIDKYGFEKRNDQIELINEILINYLDNHTKNIVLNAPTGTGKSIIAVVVGDILLQLDKDDKYKKQNYYLSHTNILSKQYEKTFNSLKDMIVVMGANNYKCEITKDTAETCLIKGKKHVTFDACRDCEYLKVHSLFPSVNHVITNYTFYFISKLYTSKMGNNILTVFDESHNINEIFIDFINLSISSQSLTKLIANLEKTKTQILSPLNQKKVAIEIDKLKKILNYTDTITKSKIIYNLNSKKGLTYLNTVIGVYNIISNICNYYKDEYEEITDVEFIKTFKMLSRYVYKLTLFKSISGEIIKNDIKSHIVDIEDNKISILPIFIKKYFKQISNSKYNLFMSATITPEFISDTLNIDKKDITFINAKNPFENDIKNLIFINYDNLNYYKTNDENIMFDISQICKNIIDEHKTESGIIQVTTFEMANIIYNNLLDHQLNHRIYLHPQQEKLENIIDEYKNYKGKKILISPSIFEGIDLPNEESKFQIMIKAPFPSIESKRWKYIMNEYNNIYQITTLYKIIQGLGRSSRNKNDKSVTYIIDGHIDRIFNSMHNVWKNQFQII